MSDYYIGLDIGTESIGWAVTDTAYHLAKRHGKSLWGVRLFPEAQKAEERRGFRTARRRLERRNQRIAWLREVFSQEIAKVDPAFFQRMDESKFLEEDKLATPSGAPLGRYTLFADADYNDLDYHHEFPTIYHLRHALLTQERAFDVRLVYLAVHHILKNRGHFLFGDMKVEDVSFADCLEELRTCLGDGYDLQLNIADLPAFQAVLQDRTLGISKKKQQLQQLAGITKDDGQLAAVLDMLAGSKVSAAKACGLDAWDADIKFSLKDDFETVEPRLIELLGDDMRLIYAIKKLYDRSLLEALCPGGQSLSAMKVAVYKHHQDDLRRLKALFRADQKLFREMFRTAKDKLDNYPAYSGHGAANYRCDYGAFRTHVKKQINILLLSLNDAQTQEAQAILTELEQGTFLPKQTNKGNGVIPHQLHQQELETILERASTYLPFLNEVDGSGLTRKQQIMETFLFRVPYYVGPLNTNSSASWVVRSSEKITPWNFESVVDKQLSAEKFITNMTATCTYIGAPVLPKDSLLYSRFAALNAINKLQINGHPIPVEVKHQLFNEHILAHGTATTKSIREYMLSNELMQAQDNLSGLAETFRTTLTGYQVFRQILSRGGTETMVEDIIRHIVLYGDDRTLLEKWLHGTYGSVLSAEDIGYILRNKGRFSGWGNLSHEFLTEIKHVDQETGECMSIMDALWSTNCNLNELLSSKYTFAQGIEKRREEKFGSTAKTLKDVLKDSYASPGIRRAIHQTMELIAEIEKLMQGTPRRVFVEMTRGEGEKKATVSRKNKLDDLYKACQKMAPEVYEQLQQYDEAALRSTKLYLYFTQMGKCMYSGKPIELSSLADSYDIDHIYPQSLVKDDSLDNKVLVKRELNAKKGDKYPVPEDFRIEMHDFWNRLKKNGLISEKKYNRLTRSNRLEDNELSDFIARQLVETSQSCKIVADLLKRRYGQDDRVVYVKAGNVSSFRQDQRLLPDGTQAQAGSCKHVQTKQDPLFLKCRDVNDFHHAKDAYLNIVVGNVYHVKFTRNPMNFLREKPTYSDKPTYNPNRMFDFDVTRGDDHAWTAGADGSIATVRSTMRRNDILFTRYAYKATGGLFDQLLMPKGKGQALIKSSDKRLTTEKYGGYNKVKGSFFLLVEHGEGKKRVRSLEPVLIMDKARYQQDRDAYCREVLGLKSPRVLIPEIKIDSLISYDGFRMHVSGRSDSLIVFKNANQLVLSPEENQYIKRMSKYLERCKNARGDQDLPITKFDEVSAEENVAMYQTLLNKLRNKRYHVMYENVANIVERHMDEFVALSVANQCRVLMQLLNLFSANASIANLGLIHGGSQVGKIRISKNLSKKDNPQIFLIHQSITGVYEQKIDLLGDQF